MKISRQRKILIVSDGKRGHVHQSIGVVEKLHATQAKKLEISMSIPYYYFLLLVSMLLRPLKFSEALMLFWVQKVTRTSIASLLKYKPDMIISTGSLTHPVTYLLGRSLNCRTVVCMRPSILKPHHFDLVVVPHHDSRRCRGDNVLYTMGATSNISEGFIFAEAVTLYQRLKGDVRRPVGLLIGGNSAMNYITKDMALELSREMLLACEENGLSLLATTSRRTPRDAEAVFENELGGHDRCAFLLLASKSDENPVPGIVGLSDFIVVTEDSVSMVSEIISGGKHAIVLQVGKRKKTNKFVKLYEDLASEGYITYTTVDKLNSSIVDAVRRHKQGQKPLDESRKVAVEIERRFFFGDPGAEVKR